MKRGFCMLLCMCLLWGCAAQNQPETTAGEGTAESTIQTTAEPVTQPTETQSVDDGRIHLYYDDCPTVLELIGTEAASVEVITEEVTSLVSGSQEADTQVLRYDAQEQRFFAVGTGLATVVADGNRYEVRVDVAPISLFMIIGHSLGAGQGGVPAQSVKCLRGQAYSTTARDSIFLSLDPMGIGYGAATRPDGIDALTTDGGVQGEAGGLAWQWNQLTGEKAWVLNAAVGGSCLNEWVSGSAYFQRAVAMFTTAQLLLQREVAAGHYRVKNVAVLYHSAANFQYKGVVYSNELAADCYRSMIDGLNEAMLDMDSDGVAEPLDAIGFVPCWGRDGGDCHDTDKPANYYMGASNDFPQLFVASMATRGWRNNQDIKNNFPQHTYETHGEPVAMPVTANDVYSDSVHLTQVAYNAVGADIAQTLYAKLRSGVQAQGVTVMTDYFMEVGDTLKLKANSKTTLILLPEPFHVSDLTVAVSQGLELGFPFTLRASQPGTYTVTLSQAENILKTITVTVE